MVKSAHLAVVIPRLSTYGGAEGFALRLAGALAGAGHAVDFLCARQETEAPPGVRVVRLGRPGLFKSLKILWFALSAEAAVRRGRYDLVFGLGKSLSQDVLRVGGGPLPVFWRLSARAWAPGPARAFKMLRRRLSPANWLNLAIEARQCRTAPVIVCVSDLVRDWMLAAHPELAGRDVRVIYNRPDLSRFRPFSGDGRRAAREALGVAPDEVLVTTAGTNFALKGIGPLLQALALLPENFRLAVAGGRGSGRWLELARALGVAGRVAFPGKVEDMPAFYNAGDIFCLASFYDACSNAVVEALACGSRVLSSASNGSAAFLDPGHVFADPGDAAALAALIERTAAEPRPGPFAWPEGLVSGLEPYLELAAERLAAKAGRGRPS